VAYSWVTGQTGTGQYTDTEHCTHERPHVDKWSTFVRFPQPCRPVPGQSKHVSHTFTQQLESDILHRCLWYFQFVMRFGLQELACRQY